MDTYTIAGGHGTQLHVIETGNSRGKPVLFIHGVSQCSLAWTRQLDSELARDFRLVAMDLRGHGQSEKPRDGYSDSRLWADDVHAVIQQLALEQPVLCGWSYGPLVILDYIRHYGESGIAGITFVGGISKLGTVDAMSAITPAFQTLVPDLLATDLETSTRGMESLVRLFFVRHPAPADLYLMLGYNLSVSAHVRQALLSRSVDNDDLLRTLRTPVLTVHGADDAIVSPAAAGRHCRLIRHAKLRLLPGSGHACFWEDSDRFNQELRSFIDERLSAGGSLSRAV